MIGSEWISNLEEGDEVVIFRPSIIGGDIWRIASVKRITKTLVICESLDGVYTARIRKRYGTETHETYSSTYWRMHQLTNDTKEQVQRGNAIESIRHVAYELEHLKRVKLGKVSTSNLKDLHNKLKEVKHILTTISNEGKAND